MKLSEIGEFGFIRRVSQQCLNRPEGVFRGIGDDCAVIDINDDEFMLVTTDLLIERCHFKLEWTSPEDLGTKSLAVNLSDIAACGGIPRDAFISLAIPKRLDVEWLDRFYRGITDHAKCHRVNILGGDTTLSRSDLMINVALTGLVPKSQALLRNGASPGDLVCLTGVLGESSAGLKLLERGISLETPEEKGLVRSHLTPVPLLREGRILAQSGYCSALIDVSDGMSSDLNHICEQSGVGAIISEEQIPVSKKLEAVFADSRKEIMKFIFHGGEDYALLAAVKPDGLPELKFRFQKIGASIYQIGEFTNDPGRVILKSRGNTMDLRPRGWDHFK